MIIKFLFDTIRVLFLWVIIGIAVFAVINFIWSDIDNAPAAIQSISMKAEPVLDKIKTKLQLNKILEVSKKKISDMTNSIACPPVVKIDKKERTDFSREKKLIKLKGNNRENNIFRRQVAIVDELLQ